MISAYDFFKNDYVDQASYDNLRKISSAVDGLKNSNRKVVHTVLDKNIKELLKVQQLAAKASEYTDYLHGSMDGVIVTLGQDFMNTNQLPILMKKGNFGTRAIQEASASRYIFAKGSPLLWDIFKKEDRPILLHQTFEGEDIEPRFFVPVIPMLLVNGSRGVSSGFSQLVGQRSLDAIFKALVSYLTGASKDFKTFDAEPLYLNGFRGIIERDLSSPGVFKWLISGVLEIKDRKTVRILELPDGAKLMPYIQFLEDLKEAKKIKDFKDLSDGDVFQFDIIFNPKDLEKHTPESLKKLLKLETSITENFTSLGADNKIKEFKKPSEIFEYYTKIKLKYLGYRKANLLELLGNEIAKKSEHYRFLRMVIMGEIRVSRVPMDTLTRQLKELDFNDIPSLMAIPVSKMTTDQMEKLAKEINAATAEYKTLEATSVEVLWLEDIKGLHRAIKDETRKYIKKNTKEKKDLYK